MTTGSRTALILSWQEVPSKCGLDSKHREQIPRCNMGVDKLGKLAAVARQIIVHALGDCHVFIAVSLLFPARKRATGDNVVLKRSVGAGLEETYQTIHIFERKGLKQHGSNDRKQCDVRADAERHDENCDHGKAGCPR